MKPEAKYRHITDALVWGGVLISVGIVLLLNSLGILSWDLWQFLWRFWPLFLIVAGLNIVFGNTRMGSILVGVVSIVLLVGAILFSIVSGGNTTSGQFNFNWDSFNPTHADQTTTALRVEEADYSDLTGRKLDIRVDSAMFNLTDNEETYFLDVQAKHPQGAGEPELMQSQRGDRLDLQFRHGKSSIFKGGERSYDLTLGQEGLSTDIKVSLGSGNGRIDLDVVKVNSVDMVVNSGTMEMSFGQGSVPVGNTTLQVNSGSLKLDLPSTVGVKVVYRVNSGNLNIDGNDIDGRGVYTSDNYSQADIRLELELNINSGTATVQFMGNVINES